jgi:cbb3-type cytochrome oxidase subunit 1
VPWLSVLMIRVALAYLAAGSLAGALLLAHRGVSLGSWPNRLTPVHVEFLLLGWTVQLALGVAFWILPRFRSGAERGSETPAWLAFVLLNIGVLTVAIGTAVGAPGAVGLLGRCVEAAAAAAFTYHAWPRVKVFGSSG